MHRLMFSDMQKAMNRKQQSATGTYLPDIHSLALHAVRPRRSKGL